MAATPKEALNIKLQASQAAFEPNLEAKPAKTDLSQGEPSVLLVPARPAASLDNRKASISGNPYFRTLSLLSQKNLTFGFLTNGRSWLLVENSWAAWNQQYLAFSLDKILAQGDLSAFALFWGLFGSLNYLPRGTNSSNKGIRETRESRIANINKL
ncbi:MAG: hypothetical protein LBT38_08500, partial [Deltaproteobacteria bacterium]|nr:hypothetical protein [Deltaproteobacteria bacterium]